MPRACHSGLLACLTLLGLDAHQLTSPACHACGFSLFCCSGTVGTAILVSVNRFSFSASQNDNGQLGTGTTTNLLQNPSTDAITGISQFAAGASHVCVVMTTTGGVRCWGAGSSGQLGNSANVAVLSPPTSDIAFLSTPSPSPSSTSTSTASVTASGMMLCGYRIVLNNPPLQKTCEVHLS